MFAQHVPRMSRDPRREFNNIRQSLTKRNGARARRAEIELASLHRVTFRSQLEPVDDSPLIKSR
jgi:hypothetical protein